MIKDLGESPFREINLDTEALRVQIRAERERSRGIFLTIFWMAALFGGVKIFDDVWGSIYWWPWAAFFIAWYAAKWASSIDQPIQ